MRYAGIIKNDLTGTDGLQFTFFTQGCPHHCPKCQNPETWDFNGGKEFTPEVMNEIISGISANGIQRQLGIQGGEPLCDENLFLTTMVIEEVRRHYPDIKIYLWTGYYYKDLNKDNPHISYILNNIDYLIDGPFIQEQRDITLKLRGSSNQHILLMRKGAS